jgi:NAD(P)-dependent dehydrogenase (short-subunit alcohol dehydrogenase family)
VHTFTSSSFQTIINTSSIGSIATFPGLSSYQPTKTVINRFTEFIHFEYETEGIRAFAYHPGLVCSSISILHAPYPPSTGNCVTDLVARVAPAEWMDTMAIDKPELAAGYAVWLVTQPRQSDFLRGRYSSCNWDVEELVALRPEIEIKDRLWTRVVGQEQVMHT